MGDDERVIEEQHESGPVTDTQAAEEAVAPAATETPDPSLAETPAVAAVLGRQRAGLPAREGRPRRGRAALDPSRTDADAGPQVDPEALALAHRIVDLAVDKKASDIVLIDIHTLTTIADYLVICSGGSERQLGGITSGIIEVLKDENVLPYGREGGPSAHWALIDYGSVVVHVMATPERDFYQLEKLWSDAPLLLHIQ
jgi:ribosome-associated protein